MPVIPIATPMSAVFKAGALFTPSPVIATVAPPLVFNRGRVMVAAGN